MKERDDASTCRRPSGRPDAPPGLVCRRAGLGRTAAHGAIPLALPLLFSSMNQLNLTARLPAWPKSTPGATPTPAFSSSSNAKAYESSVHLDASAKT